MLTLKKLFKTYGARLERMYDRQVRVFVRFVNSHLEKGGKPQITSLTELKSGVVFRDLIEILAPPDTDTTSLKKISSFGGGENAIINLSNMDVLLQFLTREEHIRLDGVNAQDVAKGDVKLILGLLWSVVTTYHVHISGDRPIDRNFLRMMKWVNSKCPDEIQVTDINSWESGRHLYHILRALEQKYALDVDPDDEDEDEPHPLFEIPDIDSLTPVEIVQRCIDYAYDMYEVPRILDADDVVKEPDELTLLTYLSYFKNLYRKKLQDIREKRRLEREERKRRRRKKRRRERDYENSSVRIIRDRVEPAVNLLGEDDDEGTSGPSVDTEEGGDSSEDEGDDSTLRIRRDDGSSEPVSSGHKHHHHRRRKKHQRGGTGRGSGFERPKLGKRVVFKSMKTRDALEVHALRQKALLEAEQETDEPAVPQPQPEPVEDADGFSMRLNQKKPPRIIVEDVSPSPARPTPAFSEAAASGIRSFVEEDTVTPEAPGGTDSIRNLMSETDLLTGKVVVGTFRQKTLFTLGRKQMEAFKAAMADRKRKLQQLEELSSREVAELPSSEVVPILEDEEFTGYYDGEEFPFFVRMDHLQVGDDDEPEIVLDYEDIMLISQVTTEDKTKTVFDLHKGADVVFRFVFNKRGQDFEIALMKRLTLGDEDLAKGEFRGWYLGREYKFVVRNTMLQVGRALKILYEAISLFERDEYLDKRVYVVEINFQRKFEFTFYSRAQDFEDLLLQCIQAVQ